VKVSLSPEYELLLDAAVPLPYARAETRRWSEERWCEVVRIAEWHRLGPLLFCRIDDDPAVPGSVREQLEQTYLANAARNLYVRAALLRALGALSVARVPVMLLKGAALLEGCYADPAQRELLDLDLLAPIDWIDAGVDALVPLGYEPDEQGEEGPRHLRLAHHHDAPLVDDQHVVAIELHRHMTIAGEGHAFAIDEVWRRAHRASAGDHMLPAGEDLLLHVCLHFTRNRLGGSFRRRQTGGALAQICDIARIVEHEPVQWDVLVDATHRYGLDTRVFLALFAARELGVGIPESALTGLMPPGFDPGLGRRLVSLRVLRVDDRLPLRSVRSMVAPSRDVLTRGWGAEPAGPWSLPGAYVRRARAQVPAARAALRRPWASMQDRRLNGEIYALEDRG
jgi:hypothetical protein